MKLVLSEYQEGVVKEVEHSYDPKELDLEFVDLHYARPLQMKGTVEKGQDTLTFRGEIRSEVENMCGRCLKQTPRKLKKDFEFYYETYGKEFVDTTDDIRETLILDHPPAYVCKESCKGLCPQCGVNRNEKTCKCPPETRNRVFANLKNLLKGKKEK